MRLMAFSPIDTNCIMQLSIDAQNGEKLLDRGEFWYYDTDVRGTIAKMWSTRCYSPMGKLLPIKKRQHQPTKPHHETYNMDNVNTKF